MQFQISPRYVEGDGFTLLCVSTNAVVNKIVYMKYCNKSAFQIWQSGISELFKWWVCHVAQNDCCDSKEKIAPYVR
ncbi:MAG: hypothetical protein HFH82_11285 [Lachnospiraceae bacterium]|nr:hypothetical protein [Lachnospiraceae bacterium]